MLLNKFKALLNNYFKGSLNNLFVIFKNFSYENRKYLKNYNIESNFTKNDIWIFDSSSKLNKISLFSAFTYLLSNELKNKNLKFSTLICASGPGYCQVGASPKNPKNPMPCKTCIETNLNLFKESDKILFKKSNKEIKNNSIDNEINNLIQPSKKWLARENKNLEIIKSIENNLNDAASKWINFLNEIGTDNFPKVAIIFNGYSFPESIVKNYLEQYGVQTFTFESGYIENSVYVSDMYAPEYLFDFSHRNLEASESEKLNNYMNRRSSGNFKRGSVDFWKNINPVDAELVNRFNKFEKLISVFLNVPYDTSQTNASRLFLNIYEWIDYLETLIKSNQNVCFVFRSHPDEVRTDKKTNFEISKYIQIKGFENYSNVVIIKSNSHVNSYELISESDLVLTYNSTITLEAVYSGTNAISAGYAHFCRLNYFELANNKTKYKQKVQQFLENTKVESRELDIISSYLYQMIFESSIDLSSNVKFVKNYEYQIVDKNILDAKFIEFSNKLENIVRTND